MYKNLIIILTSFYILFYPSKEEKTIGDYQIVIDYLGNNLHNITDSCISKDDTIFVLECVDTTIGIANMFSSINKKIFPRWIAYMIDDVNILIDTNIHLINDTSLKFDKINIRHPIKVLSSAEEYENIRKKQISEEIKKYKFFYGNTKSYKMSFSIFAIKGNQKFCVVKIVKFEYDLSFWYLKCFLEDGKIIATQVCVVIH